VQDSLRLLLANDRFAIERAEGTYSFDVVAVAVAEETCGLAGAVSVRGHGHWALPCRLAACRPS
jgi:hypothetical protein